MHKFYKTRYGCLVVESVLGYKTKTGEGKPLFTLKIAGTNNPDAKMENLKKGQYDWESALNFSVSPVEVVQITNLLKGFTKNGKLVTTLPIQTPFKVDPKINRRPISHKRYNGDRVTLILSLQNKAVTWGDNNYNRLELWFNFSMKDSNKSVIQKPGKDINGNNIQRSQQFTMMLEGEELELFYNYCDSYAKYGLLLHDFTRLFSDIFSKNNNNGYQNNNNGYQNNNNGYQNNNSNNYQNNTTQQKNNQSSNEQNQNMGTAQTIDVDLSAVDEAFDSFAGFDEL